MSVHRDGVGRLVGADDASDDHVSPCADAAATTMGLEEFIRGVSHRQMRSTSYRRSIRRHAYASPSSKAALQESVARHGALLDVLAPRALQLDGTRVPVSYGMTLAILYNALLKREICNACNGVGTKLSNDAIG